MFNVYLRKIIIPSVQIDSRTPSYGQTVDSASTADTIVFSSGITGQSSSWIGGIIIFTSGTYSGMAATIGGENKTGTTLDSILLSEAFPSVPDTGTSFILYRRGTGKISYDGKVYQISRNVSNVKFDTVIDGGYDVATITVDGNIIRPINQYSDLLNMDVIIEDDKGHRCFRGLVGNINIGSTGGTIDCVGYYRTYGWFDYGKVYAGTSDVTSTKILREISDANPFIANSNAIDRDDEWDTIQQAFGGIGPVDFSESVVSGEEAIGRVLEMGRIGISVEAVYMAIYNDPVPVLKYTSNTITAADFVLTRSNYAYNNTGFSAKGSLSDSFSAVNTTYTDTNNKTFYTPYTVNLRLLGRLGFRKKGITSNSQSGAYESTAIVQQAANDFQNMMSADQYQVSGYVYRNGMNTRVPVYYIRAGDTVKVETPYGYENIYKNSSMNATEFYVGKTSYDANSGVMIITPINDPKKSEIFSARLKV